jgi:hypothetical protein
MISSVLFFKVSSIVCSIALTINIIIVNRVITSLSSTGMYFR